MFLSSGTITEHWLRFYTLVPIRRPLFLFGGLGKARESAVSESERVLCRSGGDYFTFPSEITAKTKVRFLNSAVSSLEPTVRVLQRPLLEEGEKLDDYEDRLRRKNVIVFSMTEKRDKTRQNLEEK